MNANQEEWTPRQAAEFIIPLVRDYAEKLGAICVRAADLMQIASHKGEYNASATDAARLIELHDTLAPQLKKLIRRGAEILEAGGIGPDLALALSLRQDELVSQFRFAPTALAALESAFGGKRIRNLIERIHETKA